MARLASRSLTPIRTVLTSDPYGKGFHAYLYLGPLEDEVFSPMIPGYFSDEFVREVDRRWRIMYGKGLVEAGLVKHLDGASVVASEGQSLGPAPARLVGGSARPARRLAVRQPFSGRHAEAHAIDPSHHRKGH